MRDVTEALRIFIVPPGCALTAEQRAGAVCVWCPRVLDGGDAGMDLGGTGDWHPRSCPACYEVQGRALASYLDWHEHGITCPHCPLRPCDHGQALGAEHLAARERAGKPALTCAHCRAAVGPGEQVRPHLWNGVSAPVFSYLHARPCPARAPHPE
ncbi:hypothetical protein [Streptomyces sp. G45]|uniref:hypothetical protein n=1 Tax=Streptomyces sp. G45 TaxID=3406627 RepID=UPI003C1B1BD2